MYLPPPLSPPKFPPTPPLGPSTSTGGWSIQRETLGKAWHGMPRRPWKLGFPGGARSKGKVHLKLRPFVVLDPAC